jgi:alkylhydroperoxidase/carboxymuconolactone decarboxylase family protein YurZ
MGPEYPIDMGDRYGKLLRALLDAVGGAKGTLDAKTRQDLLAARPVTGKLGAFAVKVTHEAGPITDEHIEALREQGVGEEAIFETIIAAAVGAGLERLRAAKRALGEPE